MRKLQCEFEAGIWSGFNSVFGQQTKEEGSKDFGGRVEGCYFHLTNAWYTKYPKIGLERLLSKSGEFRRDYGRSFFLA